MHPAAPDPSGAGRVTIRPTLADDMPAIQKIYAHHVLHGLASFEEVPPTLQEMQSRRDAILKTGLPYLSAEIDGTVAGYAYAALYRTRTAYRYTVEDSIYLAPGFTGLGIGARLLDAVITECRAAGCRQMLAVIGDSGNQASIAVHERAGFRHVGTFTDVGFKFGRWVDTVMMQKTLS